MKTTFPDRLKAILEAKAEFWRTNHNDPHALAPAVYVAMTEVAIAIDQAMKKPPRNKKRLP